MSNTPTTNMTVPVHMVAQLELCMKQMNMDPTPISSATDTMIMNQCDKSDDYEVKKIISHSVYEGIWFFELLFSNGEKQIVADEDCNCEWLISNYLAEKNINTAYIFCRVSTKEQASSTCMSLEAQADEIRPLVQSYPRVKVFKISCSAYRKIPKVLEDIGECATSGDGIFVWRVDRLSRNIVKYLSWMEDLNENGVEVYSVNDELYYSSNKTKFIQAILDAQKEAELIGIRVKLVNKRKRQRGDEAIGSLPFGKKYERILDADCNTIRKIVVPHAEEIAQRTFIRSSKMLGDELVLHLNKQGSLKRGRKWSRSMICNMLK